MSAVAWIVAAFLGLAGISARTKLTGTVAGQPVSVPVLWLVFAALVLGLAAVVLVLLRLLIRDGLRLKPRMVYT